MYNETLCPQEVTTVKFKYRLNIEKFQIPAVWLLWHMPEMCVAWSSSHHSVGLGFFCILVCSLAYMIVHGSYVVHCTSQKFEFRQE